MPDDRILSRRDLLRGRLRGHPVQPGADGGAANAAATNARMEPVGPAAAPPGRVGRKFALPIHRPPGAVDELSFLAGCTRCNECIGACPVGAIVQAPSRFREAGGTPMIDAFASACVMCEDTPCITACKPGVLTRDQPMKMGVAWIQTMACLAHTGSFCSVCSERCPVPGAIEVSAGKPSIRVDLCTGCGVCLHVCPAPSNAVVVMPLADRPARPAPTASKSPSSAS